MLCDKCIVLYLQFGISVFTVRSFKEFGINSSKCLVSYVIGTVFL